MAFAHLSEVFGSIQGEGINAGIPALFLRFAGCNLECTYCDTPAARSRSRVFAFHAEGAPREFENPVECDHLIRILQGHLGSYRLAVLTGGEPLLQPSAVVSLAERLKAEGLRIQLETNGTLPEAVGQVGTRVDFVSMDIKLPSTQAGRDLGAVHREFLRMLEAGHSAVKVVFSATTPDREVMDAVRLVAEVDPGLTVYFQPVFVGPKPQVEGGKLLSLVTEASTLLDDVRVSVQLHKILGIR
jgi:7-carboxy-7-deazaguanine synthase